MRRVLRSVVLSRAALVAGASLIAGGLQVAPAAAVSAGQNASVSLSSRVSTSGFRPMLGVGLVADRTDAIPGDRIGYVATVTNTGAVLSLSGSVTAASSADVSGAVVSWYDEVQYKDKASNSWVSIGGQLASQDGYSPVQAPGASTGLTLAATPQPAAGVTYPSGTDRILGTQIGAHATASWSVSVSVAVSTGLEKVLADNAQSGGVRNVVHVELAPRDPVNGQPYVDRETVTDPFLATPGTISDVHATLSLPAGPAVTFDGTTDAGLASLAAGGSVTLTGGYVVPAVARPADDESDQAYRQRLVDADGTRLVATVSAHGTAPDGRSIDARDMGGGDASPVSATAIEHLPVLSIGKSGPSAAHAGTTASYRLPMSNAGSAAATGLSLRDALPDGDEGVVTDVPDVLAAGASAAGTATYPIPVDQPDGPLTDTARLTWADANGNPYGPIAASYTTTVHSEYVGATLTMTPQASGPDVVGTWQALRVTLVDRAGTPMPGRGVTLRITGANPITQTAVTDADGSWVFTYQGTAGGNDVAQATANNGALQSNTATVGWVVPAAPVETSTVTGRFYANDWGTCSFGSSISKPVLFTQDFPTLDFNPPAGTVAHDRSGVGTLTRPFTDVTTDVGHSYTGTVVAAGNGYQAGYGPLDNFQAVFTGSLVVAAAGNRTFNFYSDDGWQLGLAGGATYASGALYNVTSRTPAAGYPVVGGYQDPSAPTARSVVVNFPAPGTYPFEIDYTECHSGALSLTLGTSAGALPPAGDVSLAPIGAVTSTVGSSRTLTAAVMDAGGASVTGTEVALTLTGPNAQTVRATTDVHGVATFSYTGSRAGTDTAYVGALVAGMPAVSNTTTITWTQPTTQVAPPPAPVSYEEVVEAAPGYLTSALGTSSPGTSWSLRFPAQTGPLVVDARCADPADQSTTSRDAGPASVDASAGQWSGTLAQQCVPPSVLSLRLVQVVDASKGIDDVAQRPLYDIYVGYTGSVGPAGGTGGTGGTGTVVTTAPSCPATCT